MKKCALTFIVVLMMSNCGPTPQENKVDDHFLSDLSSENCRIRGTLKMDVFNGNLDTLSYEYYLTYLSTHEAPSAKGVAHTVQEANDHFFKTRKDEFLLLLYYRDAGKIVGDNSGTAFIDTVIKLSANDSIPSLSKIAIQMRF